MKFLLRAFGAFNYVFGWFFEYFGLGYRPFYSILFLLPNLTRLRIKPYALLAPFIFLLVVAYSSLLNGSGLIETLLFLRYLLVYFVIVAISNINLFNRLDLSEAFLRWFILLQIIFLIFQLLFSDFISNNSVVSLVVEDVRTGTFRLKGDPILSGFFIAIIYYFLGNKKSRAKNNRIMYFGLPLLGVLLANSTLSKIILVIMLGFFFIRLNIKVVVLLVLIIGLILRLTDFYQEVWYPISSSYKQVSNLKVSKEQMNRFKSGDYGRIAAFIYYKNNWSFFGSGPGASQDVFEKSNVRGNTGQLLLFIDEVGLVGLIVSYLLLLALCMQISSNIIEGIHLFIFNSLLTITTFPFSDIGLWFVILVVRDFFQNEE